MHRNILIYCTVAVIAHVTHPTVLRDRVCILSRATYAPSIHRRFLAKIIRRVEIRFSSLSALKQYT